VDEGGVVLAGKRGNATSHSDAAHLKKAHPEIMPLLDHYGSEVEHLMELDGAMDGQ